MKHKNFLLIIIFCLSLFYVQAVEKPDWVDSWRTIYPDAIYVAQLGKATGQDKNRKLVTSFERQNKQNITISVDLSLTSLLFTEPWYNKKEKTWYCVAYAEREKINCSFSINTQGDVNNTIYQSLKAALSEEGFTVKNSGEDAAYIVNANILLSDTEIQNIHVIKPTIDITITGKTAAVFSYSRQAENASGIDKEIASNKAVRLLKLEIEKSFMNEFNEELNHKTQADIQKLF